MGDSANNPPYPPYPPFPPYPPYPPVTIVVHCCCCGAGTAPTGGTATQGTPGTQGGTQPGGGTQAGGTPQANTFDTIAFTITPGAGQGLSAEIIGLGADSALTAALYAAGSSSSPVQTVDLKKNSDPAWWALQPQVITVTLNTPVSATALGSVKINLIPGNEDPNSLIISSVQVVLSNSSGQPVPTMLLDQAGNGNNPVTVLSANHPSITLPL